MVTLVTGAPVGRIIFVASLRHIPIALNGVLAPMNFDDGVRLGLEHHGFGS